jgi:predicted AAA+ superfamily ATPase
LKSLRAYGEGDLERDLPASASAPIHSHYHAQVRSAPELNRAFGVADTTVRGYLDLLAAVFIVRLLMPSSENPAKQQVRASKVYLRDTGLLRALLRSWAAGERR